MHKNCQKIGANTYLPEVVEVTFHFWKIQGFFRQDGNFMTPF